MLTLTALFDTVFDTGAVGTQRSFRFGTTQFLAMGDVSQVARSRHYLLISNVHERIGRASK